MATTPETALEEAGRAAARGRGHPPGLPLLFITEMWERFSYYGNRALLVLYLVNALQWSAADASNLYGTYTGFVWLSPLIGGWLADQWLGTRRSMVLGGIIISLGHFTLALYGTEVVPGLALFYAGLALIIIGTGFFKPTVSTMVGQLYRQGDPRRDSGFTIFYMGINLGAFLGPLATGTLAVAYGWHYGFGAAGVGMVLGLIAYLWGRAKYLPGVGLPPEAPVDYRKLLLSLAVFLLPLVLRPVLGAAGVEYGLGLAVFLGVVLALLFHSWGALLRMAGIGPRAEAEAEPLTPEEQHRVAALVIVVFFVIFFWSAFEQAGASLNLFADKHTDRMVGAFEVPTAWFQSINPLAILLFAPVFAAIWTWLGGRGREPSTPVKMSYGLMLLGLGFTVLIIAGARVDAGVVVSPWWLVAAYVLHTWGELCLSPIGLSLVTKLAPVKLASLLMGVWFLASAAANKVAGVLSALMPVPEEGVEVSEWAFQSFEGFFTLFVFTSVAAGAVLLLLSPMLKRMMHGRA